jgi:Zn finger protein HypA/HybF involved in hydrogenase expression
MGEIANMVLDGTLCEGCGVLIDGAVPGYPRSCSGCRVVEPPVFKHRVKCPQCGKHVKPAGLADHTAFMHGSGYGGTD